MKQSLALFIILVIPFSVRSQCSFSLSVSPVNNQCYNLCTGSATVNVTGGGGPFSFIWSHLGGPGSATESSLCSGTYSVIVTDSSTMCADTASFVISQPPAIILSLNAYPATCQNNDGYIVYNVSGGVSPYTFSISPSGTYTPGMYTNLYPGTYIITTVDANGCSATAAATVASTSNLTVSVTGTDATCGICDGSAIASVSGAAPPYNYMWSGPNGFSSSISSPSNICAGNYSLTVTSSDGCTSTAGLTIQNSGSPTVSAFTTPTSCSNCNGSIQLVGSGGTGPYEYSFNSGSTFSGSNVANGLCAGAYAVAVKDSNNCIGYSTAVVPVSSISGLSVIDTLVPESASGLGDGAIILSVSGTSSPLTYSWSNGAVSQSIYNLSSGTYTVTISDTSGNCNTYTYNLPAPSVYSWGVINGKVLVDNNSNCATDVSDSPVTGSFVYANLTYVGYVNSNGSYSIYVNPGTYAVSHTPPPALVTTCNPSYTNITVGNNPVNNIDFFDSTTTSNVDVSVVIYSTPIVPGFNGTVSIGLLNNSFNAASGTVCYVLPDSLNYLSSSVTPVSVSGDTLCFSYSGLGYNQAQSIQVYFNTPPNPALLGMMLNHCATVTANEPEVNFSNNTTCNSLIVTGSYDPNDKTVSPAGEGTDGEVLPDEELFTYLIRFQNTGNGPAVNIVILDTLSDHLDLTTFEMLSASHSYQLTILPGNILRWKFENIMLPDSGSNEPGSHGDILYRIKRKNTVQLGDKIENTAAIYFDFNPPVITNTAVNTFVEPDGLQDNSNIISSLRLFPNPASGEINFVLDNWNGEKMSLAVTDITGRIVYHSISNGSTGTISLNTLENGLYFLRLENSGSLVVKPFIVER